MFLLLKPCSNIFIVPSVSYSLCENKQKALFSEHLLYISFIVKLASLYEMLRGTLTFRIKKKNDTIG